MLADLRLRSSEAAIGRGDVAAAAKKASDAHSVEPGGDAVSADGTRRRAGRSPLASVAAIDQAGAPPRPHQLAPWLVQARVQTKRGFVDAAVRSLERAAELNPEVEPLRVAARALLSAVLRSTSIVLGRPVPGRAFVAGGLVLALVVLAAGIAERRPVIAIGAAGCIALSTLVSAGGVLGWRVPLYGLLVYLPFLGIQSWRRTRTRAPRCCSKDFVFIVPAYIGFGLENGAARARSKPPARRGSERAPHDAGAALCACRRSTRLCPTGWWARSGSRSVVLHPARVPRLPPRTRSAGV